MNKSYRIKSQKIEAMAQYVLLRITKYGGEALCGIRNNAFIVIAPIIILHL